MTPPPSDLTRRYPRLAELIGVDLRSLALLRVLLGVLLFCSVAGAAGDLLSFYTDDGVLPRGALIAVDSQWRWSLHLVNGQPSFILAVFAVQLVFAAMFALGWHTRLSTLLSFLLWASLLNRNPLVIDHGDVLLGGLLFWTMFLPLGARYSFDAALAPGPRVPQPNLHVSAASLGLLLQIAFVPFFAVILQRGPEWFPEFSAGYYALTLDRQALPAGHALLRVPSVLQALTTAAWAVQWIAPLLLFSPYFLRALRLAGLTLLIVFQLALLLSVKLGLLPLLGLAALGVFIGGWIWDAIAARRIARHPANGLRLYYDGDCAFCQRVSRLLRECLLLPDLAIAPAQELPRARALLEANHSWVVIDIDEQAHLKWAALVVLLHRSPIFSPLWPLLRLPALSAPGDAAYDFIGRRRATLSALAAALTPDRRPSGELPRSLRRFAAVALVLLFASQLQTAGLLPRFSAAPLDALMRLLRLDQRWDMFAPAPRRDGGWWVVPARLADGREIDLLDRAHAAPDYSREHGAARDVEDRRWRNLLRRLWDHPDTRVRQAYADYLCRRWNGDPAHQQAQRLMTFKLIYMLDRTPPPGTARQTEQVVAWRHECFPEETQGQIP